MAGIKEKKLYGLDHAVLNVEPPASMWMNLGYWKDTESFPEACQALLDEVLQTAKPDQGIDLLDVGIGCGDQSVYLTELLHSSGSPLVDSYVGITIAEAQAVFARSRLTCAGKIFAADAADPASWNDQLKEAVVRQKSNNKTTWLLALDTLYHFKPSRAPLFKAACGEMNASLMAFDLVLSDTASLRDKLILYAMCLVSGIPYTNLMTKTQYEALLVRAGYELGEIEMRDVSEHVFSGISRYILNRDAVMRPYGISLGRFRGAAKVFRWWGESGLVRGYIIVARHSSCSTKQ
ncbi:hypothetical protein ASPZODRAFT_137505 [Penicilliopsis zonata CBS 506.65]|uniref:Methyltransferase domain-containing protein n=1 Tax=Penicilliopsis zonata CBS 506.65 TaxID=1073090 RepID=A0A1L9S4K0_9EURO|nr:hypothetical protein ASPZODRAFT_137505 [Penicilliopsis zonata CBS 506.65]OJJ42087.1 hypothetical protein ASPZODRAFT_137505 [Penicilliopsis zonata CBS 506.65]